MTYARIGLTVDMINVNLPVMVIHQIENLSQRMFKVRNSSAFICIKMVITNTLKCVSTYSEVIKSCLQTKCHGAYPMT